MKLTLLVGPPGSGKSTLAKSYVTEGYTYINQDSQGKDHLRLFNEALERNEPVVVDRMNFNVIQRLRYLEPAKAKGYTTRIVVLHESLETCMSRCVSRVGHETIQDEKSARSALNTFFTKYERVQDSEADEVKRVWPSGAKDRAIICDLDGTLCNIDHRLHFVRGEGKKDWKSFFQELHNDKPNEWCVDLVNKFSTTHPIVYCSGRPDDHRKVTEKWLKDNNLWFSNLYMRSRGDHRSDDIVKEILLDFELLTRYTPYLVIDDRQRVVDMWRKRGFTVLQCAKGDF